MNLLLSLHMDAGYFTMLAAGINWHTWSDMPGGIIARTACEISSQQLPERLPTNAVVKESGDLFCTCSVKQGVWPVWTNWKRKHTAFTYFGMDSAALQTQPLLLYHCTSLAPHSQFGHDWFAWQTSHIITSFHILWTKVYLVISKTIVSLALGGAARGWKTQLWVAAGWGSKQRILGVKNLMGSGWAFGIPMGMERERERVERDTIEDQRK